MRLERNSWDEVSCWLCDYAWLPVAFTFILLAGWYARDYWTPTGSPVNPVPATPTSTHPTASPLPAPTRIPVTPTTPPTAHQTITPTPTLPEYIVVVVPLNWQGDRESFEREAEQELAYFYQESGIDEYFRLQIKLLDETMTADLSSNTLVYDMVEFGAEREPADRYIGLTDGDISANGNTDVTGWTTGPNSLGIVGEARADYVIAHELGHTYGLCDEYNYVVWNEQNQEFLGGCPNPFPSECKQLQTDEIYCPGAPTDDGRNSIMGPSGLDGGHGFNTPSLEHLRKVFAEFSLLRQ